MAAALAFGLAGCSGVSAPSASGPPPPAGGTGFTTAASTQQWLDQFGTGTLIQSTTGITPTTGIFNGGDVLTGIAADPTGNVVVAGYTFGAFPGFTNPTHAAEDFIAKFDPTGKQLWLQQFGTGASDYLNAIATDAAGNIYAAGFTTGAFPGATNPTAAPQALAIKFDANGNQLWLRQFPSGSGIAIRALATAANGTLLATGVLAQQTTQPPGAQIQLASQQAFAASLSASTGQTVWQQPLSPSGITILNAIAADASGNAYLAGEMIPSPAAGSAPAAMHLLAIKLASADGTQIWQQPAIPAVPVTDATFLQGIAVGPDGNAVVSGISFGTSGMTNFIAKLNDVSGQQVWFTPFGGTTTTEAGNVAIDTAGNVFVGGNTFAALLPNFQPLVEDVFLAKFNSGGQNIWLQQFGTGNEFSIANLIVGPLPSGSQLQVAVDPAGNALLGGITSGQFPGFNNSNHAMEDFVARFGP